MLAGTVSAAIQCIDGFHAMTDNAAPAMGAGWRQCMDRALETIEHVGFPTHLDLETFIVSVTAHFTCRCRAAQGSFSFFHINLFHSFLLFGSFIRFEWSSYRIIIRLRFIPPNSRFPWPYEGNPQERGE